MESQNKNTLQLYKLEKLSTLFFYLAVLFFIIGFSFTDTPSPTGWYQQFLPNLNGRSISDIFFLDSLTGWAVTPYVNINDTAYVLKTTNGGDNWSFANIRAGQFVGHNKIKFLNSVTGFVCGVSQSSGFKGLSKSIDGGFNWVSLNVPDPTTTYDDMSILNIDTIWLASSSAPTGGVFRTTNGGVSWTQQLSLGSQNPSHIYMFNARIGFAATGAGLYKTTNSGINWLVGAGGFFFDMYFTDSLTGWKCHQLMEKTTDGGSNWVNQILPSGGNIIFNSMLKFSNINKDTIWGAGGVIYNGSGQDRAMLFRTTNGGNNWLFQVPDTSIHIFQYDYIKFINKSNGWAYSPLTGVHTTTGGDTIFLSGIQKISNSIPKEYKLYQNYPNPFNPVTNIKYELKVKKFVKVIVFDITGKEVITLVNQNQSAGTYEVDFSGSNLSSGVYFYQLTIDGNVIDTKKMILLK